MSYDIEVTDADGYDFSFQVSMNRLDDGKLYWHEYYEKIYELLDEALMSVEDRMLDYINEQEEQNDD